ncbi:MAG: hypothetical protein MK212_17125 [Saprospiraceae bacterium]|nr:hypothetical protein [Saprospiraceae bacterium]
MLKQALFVLIMTALLSSCGGDLTKGTNEQITGTEVINIAQSPNPMGNNNNSVTPAEVSVSVVGTKTNVLYIGMDNPIEIVTKDRSTENLKLAIKGGTITKGGNGWTVRVHKPGKAVLTVVHPTKGKFEFTFQIKRVPTPLVVLTNGEVDGAISASSMRVQEGLMAKLKEFPFDCSCAVQSYTLYYIPKGGEKVELQGIGGKIFTGKIKNLLTTKVKSGDMVLFQNVKVRCPGDMVNRQANGLSFIIK